MKSGSRRASSCEKDLVGTTSICSDSCRSRALWALLGGALGRNSPLSKTAYCHDLPFVIALFLVVAQCTQSTDPVHGVNIGQLRLCCHQLVNLENFSPQIFEGSPRNVTVPNPPGTGVVWLRFHSIPPRIHRSRWAWGGCPLILPRWFLQECCWLARLSPGPSSHQAVESPSVWRID